MPDSRRGSRSRIVIDAPARQRGRAPVRRSPPARNAEVWVAISVIIAAALATFLALFVTSRPYDPMSTSLNPQQSVPAGPSLSPTPKPSASVTPTPVSSPPATVAGSETESTAVDDASIQSGIEKAMASDSTAAGLDVSTLVEGGRVTIVGSVKSAELKQRVERIIRAVRGVTGVDNQLVITEATP